jgi:hypothetical protein
MKASVLVPALALVAFAASSAVADDFKREQDLSAKEGKPAPPLDATNWMNTPDNKALDLESLRGSVVVIDFWGTW